MAAKVVLHGHGIDHYRLGDEAGEGVKRTLTQPPLMSLAR
jgi:hypothetical protein